MDLNKLSYWENIWELKSNIKECKVLHIESYVEYKLIMKEIKIEYEECDLGVGFNIAFKADYHRHGNWWVIFILQGIQRRVIKIII